MLHRLVNLVTALSLVLCITTIILWIRSARVGDWADVGRDRIVDGVYRSDLWQIASGGGTVYYYHGEVWTDDPRTVARYAQIIARSPRGAAAVEHRTGEPGDVQSGLYGDGDGASAWGGFVHADRLVSPDGADQRWQRGRHYAAPHWAASLIFAAIPIGWTFVRIRRQWVRGRVRSAGRCISCGYDLRASYGRCPECGVSTRR